MRGSLILGIIGGIFSFLSGIYAYFIEIMANVVNAFGGNLDISMFPILIALAFIAGTLGIIGGAMGKKKGGVVLITGGILALIATSFFGVLPCVLMIVGGILALRERGEINLDYPPLLTQQISYICPRCRSPLSYIVEYQRYYCYSCQQYV